MIVAVLAIVAAGVSANQIPKVSEKPKCPPSGTIRLPHPTKCTLYYVCQDGESTIRACPDGLHFNKYIEQCDWPETECFAASRPETQPSVPEDEDEDEDNATGCVGTCPIPDPMDRTIHLPYRGDCTKFCKCSNGTPFVMPCPAGLHYDAKEFVCNWPRIAKCQW